MSKSCFFDREATPRGYIIWAYLATDTEQRLLNQPDFLIHPSERNEGGRLWVVDVFFPRGAVFEAMGVIKEHFKGRGVKEVFWVRRNNDHTIKRLGATGFSGEFDFGVMYANNYSHRFRCGNWSNL
ncbi:toxin-activating lysine-acyltransferase [Pseudomonas putida]|nr:toxin-activating lysine-acyltransferase [Pseudomonas putida]